MSDDGDAKATNSIIRILAIIFINNFIIIFVILIVVIIDIFIIVIIPIIIIIIVIDNAEAPLEPGMPADTFSPVSMLSPVPMLPFMDDSMMLADFEVLSVLGRGAYGKVIILSTRLH